MAKSSHIKDIKGFLAEDEGRALFELGKKQGGLGPCLEIGGYCGLSTVWLGLGIKESGGVLFSIDHHQGSEEHQPGEEYHDPDLVDPRTGCIDSFPEFRQNMRRAGLEDTVVPVVAGSVLVARQWATPLALVFIDGGHSLETAVSDYRSWALHVIPGGILAVHDIFFDPTQGGQAPHEVYQTALASDLFQKEGMINTLGILRRL
ncbi:MAG: class I SAM-dependent methyltransferase [Desulfohalobiaceae bacterium]|nr:class I SAM-dependent methyltransferase [Desulfohalobiaceae bacterium]